MKIREDTESHMQQLQAWLAETQNQELEEMAAFFARRTDEYEAHMAVWADAYRKFARLLPEQCGCILDLGCGTGLELDEIWKQNPRLAVTGVDLCRPMLDQLQKKHPDKPLTTVCADYFRYDMGKDKWDAVISFESLHHFFPEQKSRLYRRIFTSLKPGGWFLLGDYIACCDAEETLLRRTYLEKRKKARIPDDVFVHFDIPLTLTHEIDLWREAGFSEVTAVDSIAGATLLTAKKAAEPSA